VRRDEKRREEKRREEKREEKRREKRRRGICVLRYELKYNNNNK
jgi:hypothetical protein